MQKSKKALPDVQNQKDHRNIPIEKVGINSLRYPLTVLDKQNKKQNTVASINMYVNLPRRFRGTHMSRFVEILNEYRGLINVSNVGEILSKTRSRLNASSAHIEITFSYFIDKPAPISKVKSLMEYKCRFIASQNTESDFILEVDVPVTTLCPCSKEISEHNAHNQRSFVKAQVRWAKDLVWIEDLVELIENCASSPVYSLLKREDEKYITEHAYDRPVFVEDLVREVARALIKEDNITWFRVESENFESIHNHNAYAVVEWDRKNQNK
jgi:GTP cyclohydrolase I